MKPIYLTYTNGKDPYLEMANNLGKQIADLKAGGFFHLCLDEPGRGRNFWSETQALLYSVITKNIDIRPVIYLDSDHELKKPIIDIFEEDWDIAAAYRKFGQNESGRQDYCGGLVALNNKRPNLIREFWLEWTYKTIAWKIAVDDIPGKQLKETGWTESWAVDQSALNAIILPKEGDVEIEKVYKASKYKIMPLRRELYSARPRTQEAFIIHYKGLNKPLCEKSHRK